MADNSFTVLGSSSGMPQPNRACAGYVLAVNGRLNLMDCGGGVCSSFLRAGFDPLLVDRIFISHAHADHCCELPLFVQMVYLAGQTDCLDIYVPEELVNPLNILLNALYLFREKLPFDLRVIGYAPGLLFSDGFTLTALANQHLRQNARLIEHLTVSNRMESHSLDVEIGDKSLLYSADIGGLADIQDRLCGRDYVVTELTHVDLEHFFQAAATARVGQFVITHLGTTQEIHEIEQWAEKAGVSALITAYDGLRLTL